MGSRYATVVTATPGNQSSVIGQWSKTVESDLSNYRHKWLSFSDVSLVVVINTTSHYDPATKLFSLGSTQSRQLAKYKLNLLGFVCLLSVFWD